VCAGAVLFVTGLNCWSLSCKDFDYHSFFLSMLASGNILGEMNRDPLVSHHGTVCS
jgi:hypothetical protein